MKYFRDDHKRWWHEEIDDDSRHERIVPLIQHLKQHQSWVEGDYIDHLNIYADRDYSSDGDWGVKISGSEDRMGSNPVRSGIDTIVGKICSPPRTMFLTEGGRWDTRRKARKLQKAIDGVKHEGKYVREASRAMKDAAIGGTGYVHVYFEGGKVHYERVFPLEIVVDEQAAAHCQPTSKFRQKKLPLEAIIDRFPEKQGEILSSQLARTNLTSGGELTSMVNIYEAWHLKSENSPGLHCIVLNNCTLLCEPWDHDFYPIFPIRWNELPVGWYGSGAVEETRGVQTEHNYMLERIQTSVHNNASKYLIRHSSDQTSDQQFTNQDDTIITWSGQHPPEVKVNPMIDPQFLEHCWRLRALVFEDIGVSEMSASSKKPKGIESGAGLQHLTDQESQRHIHIHKAWEQLDLETSKATIALLKENLSGGKSDFKVKYDNGRFLESIDWSEVNLPQDDYILKSFPTNLLPTQPAAKVEKVMQWLQSGVVDSLTASMMIDFPDTEDSGSLLQASIKSILWVIDRVIYEDDYIEPKEWYDLENGIRFMQMALSRAELEGAPEETLDMGVEWIVDAKNLLQPPPPTPAEMPPMDPGMVDPATGMPMDPGMQGLPPPMLEGGPAANLAGPPPPGTVVPGM